MPKLHSKTSFTGRQQTARCHFTVKFQVEFTELLDGKTKIIFTNKDLKYAEVKWQTFKMAFSDCQTVRLSSSDSKYVVSFIKICANLPEMKLCRDNKKPDWLQTAEEKMHL